MKALKSKNSGKAGQTGFTIIELVVVILLLGILTATALPRFMDVTDSAHEAVFAGVTAGLATGIGLYHAQWVGNGQPSGGNGLTGFGDGTLGFSTEGYPAETSGGDGAIDNGSDCTAIFTGLLQGGRPTVDTVSGTTGGNAVIGDLTFSSGADFTSLFETTGICSFWYIAQGSGVSSPGLRYVLATGEITSVAEL